MITVEDALQIISSTVRDYGTEQVALIDAAGRILREPLIADRPMPPYDRITMDGIAIAFDTFERGQRTFPIAGIAAAGSPRQKLNDPEACLEAMTGGILPEGTDTVIRYEDLHIENLSAKVLIDDVMRGQNIHRCGIDRQAGELVARAGTRVSAAEIGLGATLGCSVVKVSRLPKTIIISTGDELVDIHEQPLPHQIRRSNVYRLQATLAGLGITARTSHLRDNPDEIRSELARILASEEVIILSGGVSKGKFDFLPVILEELGVKKHFHRISQRPGKPFWFGESREGALVFALPGNPVSSFLCTHRYFIPWLHQSMGLPPGPHPVGVLAHDFTFRPDLTYFLQVRVSYTPDGHIMAHPIEGNGSGDLANLVDADAFLQLPRGKDTFKAGEAFPLFFYR